MATRPTKVVVDSRALARFLDGKEVRAALAKAAQETLDAAKLRGKTKVHIQRNRGGRAVALIVLNGKRAAAYHTRTGHIITAAASVGLDVKRRPGVH